MSYGNLISVLMLLMYLSGVKFVESDETCHGDLRVKDERGNCICRLGYEGEKNSIAPCNDINECLDNPCQKGGSCVNMEGDYYCSCLPGWEGKNCSEAVDACADNPCQNGGTCNNLREAYNCMCPQGFDGENCTDIVEAPSIIEPPQTEVRVVEGMNVSVTCSCKGSPNPHLSWRFNNSRHEIVTNGLTSSISIKFVMRADASECICFTENKHGTAKAAGRLVVRVNEILQTSWIILAIVLIVILIIGVIWLIKQWKKRGSSSSYEVHGSSSSYEGHDDEGKAQLLSIKKEDPFKHLKTLKSHISDQVTDIGEDYQVDNNTDVLEQSEPSNVYLNLPSTSVSHCRTRPQLPECICSRSYENDQQIHKCDKCRRLENDSMANDFLENPQVHKRSENLIVKGNGNGHTDSQVCR